VEQFLREPLLFLRPLCAPIQEKERRTFTFSFKVAYTLLMRKIKELIKFVQAVANDPRIPDRDKTVLLGMVALIISPVDLIPDWIPIIGWMDDLVLLAIVLDYFFNHLDQDILLSHYPWDMKSFIKIKKTAQIVATLTPGWIKFKIWKFKPSVYR
jgi:uncharacterized membrane protein YkvA (DUF1232 family)